MQDVNIVFHNGVLGLLGKRVRPGLDVPTGEPEEAAAADDRHLSHGIEHGVAAEHGDGAAVVLALNEVEVLGHQEAYLVLRCLGVEPLRPSHQLRADVRAQR